MNWRWKKSEEQILDEEEIKGIVDNLLNRDDVERLISPKSDEYFLIDRLNEYCMVIADERITIANHTFSVPVDLGLSFNEEMKKIVRNKIEIERQELKKSLFENRSDLLKRIRENTLKKEVD